MQLSYYLAVIALKKLNIKVLEHIKVQHELSKRENMVY